MNTAFNLRPYVYLMLVLLSCIIETSSSNTCIPGTQFSVVEHDLSFSNEQLEEPPKCWMYSCLRNVNASMRVSTLLECTIPICGKMTTDGEDDMHYAKKYPLYSTLTEFLCETWSTHALLLDRPFQETAKMSSATTSDTWMLQDGIEEGYIGLHTIGDLAMLVHVRFDVLDGANSLLMSIDTEETTAVVGGTIPKYKFVTRGEACDSLYVKADAAMCYEYASASNLSFLATNTYEAESGKITQGICALRGFPYDTPSIHFITSNEGGSLCDATHCICVHAKYSELKPSAYLVCNYFDEVSVGNISQSSFDVRNGVTVVKCMNEVNSLDRFALVSPTKICTDAQGQVKTFEEKDVFNAEDCVTLPNSTLPLNNGNVHIAEVVQSVASPEALVSSRFMMRQETNGKFIATEFLLIDNYFQNISSQEIVVGEALNTSSQQKRIQANDSCATEKGYRVASAAECEDMAIRNAIPFVSNIVLEALESQCVFSNGKYSVEFGNARCPDFARFCLCVHDIPTTEVGGSRSKSIRWAVSLTIAAFCVSIIVYASNIKWQVLRV
eukprot:6213563-Pleurochrysis_carterae.AAC.2